MGNTKAGSICREMMMLVPAPWRPRCLIALIGFVESYDLAPEVTAKWRDALVVVETRARDEGAEFVNFRKDLSAELEELEPEKRSELLTDLSTLLLEELKPEQPVVLEGEAETAAAEEEATEPEEAVTDPETELEERDSA